MQPSKYLNRFQRLVEQARDTFELTGDYLIVERIPDEELKTQSGLIIATTTNQINTIAEGRPKWHRVLVVGEGYYSVDTDPETGAQRERTVPLNSKPGDIVLLPSISVRYFSVFGDLTGYEPDAIGISKESEVQLRFKGEDGYRTAFSALNSGTTAVKDPVESGN